jgi:hypothetical protein
VTGKAKGKQNSVEKSWGYDRVPLSLTLHTG